MQTTPSEKISALLAKKSALENRIKRLKNREASTERRTRNRALLLLGLAVEKQLKQEPGNAISVRSWIAKQLQPDAQGTVIDYLFSPSGTSSVPSADNGQS